jgi:CheY-like chemotaxis protein
MKYENEKILIVDDDDEFYEPLKIKLKRLGYQNVVSVSSGKEALEVIDNKHRDTKLILLDQNMPGMDGLTTFQLLKEKQKGLIVIMVTADDNKDLVKEFLRAGGDDIESKITMSDLDYLNFRIQKNLDKAARIKITKEQEAEIRQLKLLKQIGGALKHHFNNALSIIITIAGLIKNKEGEINLAEEIEKAVANIQETINALNDAEKITIQDYADGETILDVGGFKKE